MPVKKLIKEKPLKPIKKIIKKNINLIDTLAVFEIQQNQFITKIGSILNLKRSEEKKLCSKKVFLIIEKDNTKIGTPYLENASVELEKLKDIRSKKLRIMTYKAKSRYRKIRGSRNDYSQYKVIDIKY